MTNPRTTTLSPEEIVAGGAGEPLFLRLPDRAKLFKQRAARMQKVAIDHPMGEYLGLMSRVAAVQGALLHEWSVAVALPDAAALAIAKTHHMPPLAVQAWQRDPAWHDVLRQLVDRIRPQAGEGARGVLDNIATASPEWIEDQANRILNQRELELDRGAAVFIAAALQVYWTHMTTTLGDQAFGRLQDVANVCPCCGSHPVASILRPAIGTFQRYLTCSLCAAEWNYSRIKCVTCGNDKDLEYLNVEQIGESIKAECCPECNSYSKILYTEKAPDLEAVADDLASIGLDFALAETTAFQRANINLALFPGDEAEND